jgi:hypothetical protein
MEETIADEMIVQVNERIKLLLTKLSKPESNVNLTELQNLSKETTGELKNLSPLYCRTMKILSMWNPQ